MVTPLSRIIFSGGGLDVDPRHTVIANKDTTIVDCNINTLKRVDSHADTSILRNSCQHEPFFIVSLAVPKESHVRFVVEFLFGDFAA